MRKNPGSPLEAMMDPAAAERAREKGYKKPKKRRLARVCTPIVRLVPGLD